MTEIHPDIAYRVSGKEKDLGEMVVRRVLPAAARRSVGPFIFFDQMGPATFPPGAGMSVRPHPHINLATVTYLFEGEIIHRDSLGCHQAIHPGAINWMTAGRGIVHSERTSEILWNQENSLFGIQLWLGLPANAEEMEPEFHHHPAETLPSMSIGGAEIRLLAGSAFGSKAPTRVYSPLFYADVRLPAGSRLPLDCEHEERAAYLVSGAIRVGDFSSDQTELIGFTPGRDLSIEASEDSRLLLLGGEPFAEARHLWWNFVSSDKARIEAAKNAWREQDRSQFPLVPGDEDEFIPLPD